MAAGGGPSAYANPARDVLLVVVEGGGTLELDDRREPLGAPVAVVVPKGTRFRVEAGADGIRYLTAHLRRGGLEDRPRRVARARSPPRSHLRPLE